MAFFTLLARQARTRLSSSVYRNPSAPLSPSSLPRFSSSSCSKIARPSGIAPSAPSAALNPFRASSSGSHGTNAFLFGFSTSALLGSITLLFAFSQPTTAEAEAAAAPPSPPSHPAMGGPVVCRSGRLITKLKIFVGYDTREDLAYEICRHSLLKHATLPIEVIPIKQAELRRSGVYTRARDPTESTEFSFTRFLTPHLAGYEGWAMFVDCDFLYTGDIRELVELIDDKYAIMCVQHDYTPKTATKMDGVVQTAYPRKNWSSMVLYNCAHPKNRVLSPAVVNSQSGAFLHRFLWLDDKDIGSIPFTWNFLVGHNEMPSSNQSLPKAIHYTSGGPWFEAWQSCDYAQDWLQEKEEYKRTHMIQKVIQSELVHMLDTRLSERERKLEERVTDMEIRLKEIASMQRLLLFHLQERMVSASGNGNGIANGNGNSSIKEVPLLKSDDTTLLEERLASAKVYGNE